MPIKHHIRKLLFGPPRLTREEAMKVFKRDHYKCQYCGLDGLKHFENWLVLTVDNIRPHGSIHKMDNLVTACRPCNVMKGKHTFHSLEDAKHFVLAKREEWRKQFEQTKHTGTTAAAH